MKIFRYAMMAVLVLGLSGVASATIIHVLDPSTPQASSPNFYDLNTSIDFSFYTCPSGISNGGAIGCFSAVNYTGSVITDLFATVTSTIPVPDPTDFQCPTDSDFGIPQGFTGATCSASGDTMTFDFTGGDIQPFSTIWIIEEGIDPGDFPDANDGQFIVSSVPEPSSLWLALTGMSSLGYVVRRRFKATQA